MPAQGENQSLDGEDLSQRALVELGKDSLLQAVHELVQLVDDREVRIDRLIDDGVHQLRRTVGCQLRFPLQQLSGSSDGIGVIAMNRDEVILTHEEADVDGVEVVRVFRRLAEGDGADDQQQILIELLELDPRLRVNGLLDRQGMEMECLP